MGFQSLPFLALLALCALACPAAARRDLRAAKRLLLAACAVFYAWGLGRNALWGLGVLLAGSCVSYGAGRRFASGRGGRGRRVLALAAAWHLAVLAGFKYLGFFTGGAVFAPFVPLGLSFFTFQQLWFLKEVGTGALSGGELSALDGEAFALFGLFFPTVASGPILRPGAFFPQLRGEAFLRPDWGDRAAGLYAIAFGMAKKVLLADSLGAVVDNGYADPGALTAPGAWLVILGYTLQLYFDFSGYCDIAAGAARLLGIRLPANFDSPYRSLSVGEFWRRWHITLTAFLRECLYFPLGGGRRGAARTAANILLVFLASGLWHGAGWTFLAWGLAHGLAQVLERAWPGRERLPKALRWAGTFLFLNLAWVLFRAPSLAAAGQVFSAAFAGAPGLTPGLAEGLLPSEAEALGVLLPALAGEKAGLVCMAAVFLTGLAAAVKPGNTLRRMESFRPTAWRCAVCCGLLGAAALSFSGVETFIYANF